MTDRKVTVSAELLYRLLSILEKYHQHPDATAAMRELRALLVEQVGTDH